MVEKYTVSELAEILGVSTTAIYKKLDKKQLESVKERVGTRELTYILLNKNDLNKLVLETNCNKEITRVGFKQYNEPIETSINQPYNAQNQSDYIDLTKQVIQLTQNISNQFENYSKQMVEYAEKAGQVYLLTDNLNQEKKESETYKTEYFKYKIENENLTFHNNILKSEIDGLKLQIKTLEGELLELREQNDKLKIKSQVKEIYREEQEKTANSQGFLGKLGFKKRK